MPFTLAHPAVVLPVLRKLRPWLSATGLILGSMAPDFEYFLRLRSGGGFGHSVLGLLLIDLPLTVLIAGLFHGLVKKPLVRNMPAYFRARFGRLAKHRWPLRTLWNPRFLLAALVGSISHIAWDDLTHSRGPIAAHFSPLTRPVLHHPLYTWLQNGSSLAGLAVIGWFIWKLPAVQKKAHAWDQQQRLFWLHNLLFLFLFWPIFMVDSYPFTETGLPIAIIVTGISAGSLALLFTALLLRFMYPRLLAKKTT